MSPEEVEKKAAWLMEPVLGKKNSDQIIESIRRDRDCWRMYVISRS